MKNLFPLTIVATLAASSIAFAVDPVPAYSKPSGYVTQTLLPNQFTLLGVTLQNSALASGALTGVSGSTLTDTNANIQATAGKTYILELVSGGIAGVVQAVPAANITAKTIQTPDNLGALGAAVGNKYNLRLAPTLEEIFGTASLAGGGNLYAALSSNTADIVWVSNGNGGFNKYFLHTSGQFRLAGTTTATPNIPVIYADALYVEKRSAQSVSKDLVLTGQVKTTGTNSTVSLGFNALSVVSPAGATLKTAGLESGMYQALSPSTADNLWVPQVNGSYVKYFRRNGQWRLVSAPTVDLAANVDPVLPSAVLIERRSAVAGTTNVLLQVPASYNGL